MASGPTGRLDPGLARAEDAETFDAFNDDTFGGGGEGDEWNEDAHEALAAMTEEEMKAVQASEDFFDLGGDDADELDGALGGALEEEPTENGNKANDGLQRERDQELAQALEKQLHVQHQPQPAQHHHSHPQPPQPTQQPPPPQFQQPHPPQHQQPPQPHSGYPPMPPMPVVVSAVGAPPDDPAIVNVGRIPHGFPPGAFPPPPGQPNLPNQPQFAMPPPQPSAQPALPAPPPSDPAIMSIGKLPPGMMPPPPPQKSMQQLEAEAAMMHQQRMEMQHRQQHRPPPPQQHFHNQRHQHQQQFHQHHQHQYQQRHPHHQHHHHHQFHHGYQQQQQHHHHGHHQQRNRNPFDDRNRDTFGDEMVDEQRRQHHQQQDQQRHGHGFDHDPARRDLMPGHVHVLGVLRGQRERGGEGGSQIMDRMTTMATGNPMLDLDIERKEKEEAMLREYYTSSAQSDEFAGLMTPRERQWIVNIQLQQLKCENPFVDDYYFTVYNQKKEREEAGADGEGSEDQDPDNEDDFCRQMKRDEEGPNLLMKLQSSKDNEEYKPHQFVNSLGKLQAVTVKAPRKIIDVGVVNVEAADQSSQAQKDSRNYKNTLMEIERMYSALIAVEDCEKKIAALPTNTAMRAQVEAERAQALQNLRRTLAAENRMKRYLLVRKGKTLLKRCARLLDEDSMTLLCTTLFQLFPLAVRRDKDDQLLPGFWPHLKRHLRRSAGSAGGSSSADVAVHYACLLDAGKAKAAAAGGGNPKIGATFENALSTPLGTTLILYLLKILSGADVENANTEEKSAVFKRLEEAAAEVGDSAAAPLEKVEVNGSGLPDSKQLTKLAILGMSPS